MTLPTPRSDDRHGALPPGDLALRAARLLRRLRLHVVAVAGAVAAAPAFATGWLVAALVGPHVGWSIGLGLWLLPTLAMAGWAARRHHASRLAGRIDAGHPAMDDSTALALRPPLPAGGLAALQQARAAERLRRVLDDPATERRLRVHVPRRAWAASGLLGASLAALAIASPAWRLSMSMPSKAAPVADRDHTALLRTALTVTAPPYVGQPVRTLAALDAQVPADSRLDWSIELDRDVAGAALVWSDGARTPLARDGDRRWRGTRALATSALYRIELAGAPPLAGDPLRRIDAVADTPPRVTATEPTATLTPLAAGQTRWTLAFDAEDDHGLGAAVLSLSLAQGSGEQIKVTRRTLPLEGDGDARHRTYRRTLDLASLGYAQGDDLIAQLDVADNRAPTAQHGSSPNLVLRWAAPAASESDGMDTLAQKVLPAYLRSERQIIIDTEALLAERGTLSAKVFAARADGLGVDQKVLRQRYGQFLGEGFESAAERTPAEALAIAASAASPASSENGAVAKVDAQARAALRGLPPEATAGPGRGDPTAAVVAEFGHAHDQAEASTLLDPATRDTLKRALAAMWQAELHLRQAELEAALPPEYVALDAIKEVQQAERIYLARAGQSLPQVDADRRLGGDRKGLADRVDPLPPPAPDDTPASALWAALAHGDRPDLSGLTAWIGAHPERSPDRLGLLSAVDRVRRAPDCAACREALQARLWPLLPVPATGVQRRQPPDAAGAAYLDALRAAAEPATTAAAPPVSGRADRP